MKFVVVRCNRPFAAKPSRDLLFIKLWPGHNLANFTNGKSMSKISKWPSLRLSSFKNEIL